MSQNEKEMLANRASWDHLVSRHVDSDYYNVAGFLHGDLSLGAKEMEEVGDVRGKTMLHLQCHFGLDTLSWARLGAKATGVDFSEEAITAARQLSVKSGVPADFICSNVYDLPDALFGEFDIVFSSHGVLCWLPDLPRWAQIAASFLKPGGFFYLIQGPPFSGVFDEDLAEKEFRVAQSYFRSSDPVRFEGSGSYAVSSDGTVHTSYEWTHTVSDVLNSIIGAGMRIEFFREFSFSEWHAMKIMEQDEDGLWRLPDDCPALPFTFSVKATKPQ